MPAAHSYPLDPHEVLGIAADSSLEAIRAAYHAKAKTHHPDRGGDAWAFRIVTWAYQNLSTARIVGRAAAEMASRPAPAAAPVPRAAPADGRARPGVRDKGADPARTVEVELLLIRFEVTDPTALLFGAPEDRNLSSSLNLTWPARSAPALPAAEAAAVLGKIADAFDAAALKVHPVSARSRAEESRFAGWLSFAGVARAEAASRALHAALNEQGLDVAQSIRDIFVPRDWR